MERKEEMRIFRGEKTYAQSEGKWYLNILFLYLYNVFYLDRYIHNVPYFWNLFSFPHEIYTTFFQQYIL